MNWNSPEEVNKYHREYSKEYRKTPQFKKWMKKTAEKRRVYAKKYFAEYRKRPEYRAYIKGYMKEYYDLHHVRRPPLQYVVPKPPYTYKKVQVMFEEVKQLRDSSSDLHVKRKLDIVENILIGSYRWALKPSQMIGLKGFKGFYYEKIARAVKAFFPNIHLEKLRQSAVCHYYAQQVENGLVPKECIEKASEFGNMSKVQTNNVLKDNIYNAYKRKET